MEKSLCYQEEHTIGELHGGITMMSGLKAQRLDVSSRAFSMMSGMIMWITARSVTNVLFMRKEFSLSYPIKSAILYILGLGLYQLSINGHDIQSRNADIYET